MIPYILRMFPHALEVIYRESLSIIYETIQHIFEEQAPDVVYDAVTGQHYNRWLEIKDKTSQMKQGETTILIDTGLMRNFIDIYDDVVEENRYEGRIGIFYGPPLEYAKIHEFGGLIKITVTQKMRNFFVAMFLQEATDKGMIPPRARKAPSKRPARRPTKIPTATRPRKRPARRVSKRPAKKYPGIDMSQMEWKPLRADKKEIFVIMPQRSFLRRGLIMSTQDVVDLTISIIISVIMGVFNPSGVV